MLRLLGLLSIFLSLSDPAFAWDIARSSIVQPSAQGQNIRLDLLKTEFWDVGNVHVFRSVATDLGISVGTIDLLILGGVQLTDGRFLVVFNRSSSQGRSMISSRERSMNAARELLLEKRDEFRVLSWRDLPISSREQVIEQVFPTSADKMQSRASDLVLTYSATDDLESMAKELAGERDHMPILALLKERMEGRTSVTMPLEQVLHLFIQRSLGLCASTDGPSCFDAVFSVNLETDMSNVGYQDYRSIAANLRNAYRKLDRNEKPQLGDAILYLDRQFRPMHAVTYINDEFVFNKPSYSHKHGYMFQARAEVDHIWRSICPRREIYRVISPDAQKVKAKVASSAWAAAQDFLSRAFVTSCRRVLTR